MFRIKNVEWLAIFKIWSSGTLLQINYSAIVTQFFNAILKRDLHCWVKRKRLKRLSVSKAFSLKGFLINDRFYWLIQFDDCWQQTDSLLHNNNKIVTWLWNWEESKLWNVKLTTFRIFQTCIMNHFMFQVIWIVPIFNTIQILKKILYYDCSWRAE